MTSYFVADSDHIREINKEIYDVFSDFAHGYSVIIEAGPRTTKALRNPVYRVALAATMGLNSEDIELIIEDLTSHINVEVFRVQS